MKTELLKELGLSEEQIAKVMAENGRDIEGHKAKMEAKEVELEAVRAELTAANAAMAQFEDMDVEGIKRAAEEWKAKYDADTRALEEKLAAQDYSFAAREAAAGLRFTSESAKKTFMTDLAGKKLPVQNGKLLGLGDFVKAYREADPGAFTPDGGMPTLVLGGGKKPLLAVVTSEQYKKMGYAERLKLKSEQPELYKELTAKE